MDIIGFESHTTKVCDHSLRRPEQRSWHHQEGRYGPKVKKIRPPHDEYTHSLGSLLQIQSLFEKPQLKWNAFATLDGLRITALR